MCGSAQLRTGCARVRASLATAQCPVWNGVGGSQCSPSTTTFNHYNQAQPFLQVQDRVDLSTPLIISILKTQAASIQLLKKSNQDSSPRGDRKEAGAATPPVRPYRKRLAEKL